MEFHDAEAEREEFQRRSDNYQPDVAGPLVSPKKSISELITEYQDADPVFVTKLSALARDHSTYRAVKRDGKCGWTAGVFAYFETLLNSDGGAAKIQVEIARLREFNHLIESKCGYDLGMVEFALDETFEFLGNLHDLRVHGTASENHLYEVFNSENTFRSDSIIYHFKLMASAYMQAHPDDYSNFLDQDLHEYCRNSIEPQAQEIDYPGLQALASGVICPAGINFNVLYLDRSAGSEVNIHQMGTGHSNMTIELLFRPGHYDLIYKDAPMTVNLQHRMPDYNFGFTNPNAFSNIETMSILSPDSSLVTNPSVGFQNYGGGANYSTRSNQWQYMQDYSNSSSGSSPPRGMGPPTDVSHVTPENIMPQRPPRINDPIRFNEYTYRTEAEMPLITPVFKNSPFNPNHFQNSSFHPQEYHPHESSSKMRARRTSSAKSPTHARPRTGRQGSMKRMT